MKNEHIFATAIRKEIFLLIKPEKKIKDMEKNNRNMKKAVKYVVAGLCIASLPFSAGAYMKANAAVQTVNSSVPGQPVDLTYAAGKAIPAVVHIKYVKNAGTKEVEVQSSPFDFFSDPFGFFGNPGPGRRHTETSRANP